MQRVHLLPPRAHAPDDDAAAAAISTRRDQIMRGAYALEARAIRGFEEGENILLTAIKYAEEARAKAAGAEAKVWQRRSFLFLI